MTEKTAPLDLDAIAARLADATPGPWTAHDDGLVWADRPGDPVSGSTEQADATFIAHARQDVEDLAAEVVRLRQQLAGPCGSCHPCSNYVSPEPHEPGPAWVEPDDADMYRRRYFEIQDVLDDAIGSGDDAGAGQGIVADIQLLAQRYADLKTAIVRGALAPSHWEQCIAEIEAAPLRCEHGVDADEDCRQCLAGVEEQISVGASALADLTVQSIDMGTYDMPAPVEDGAP